MTSPTTAAAAPALLSFREVLRGDVIRRVWYAQMVSLFGDFLAIFAVIAVVTFTMHGTPSQLTLVQISYMLPLVILGPLAGVFVDRWPIKATMVASDLLRAVLAVLLMFSTELWHFYLVLALISTVSSFFGPAQAVTIRTHVPVSGLMSANALIQIGFMSARIAGPIVAGTLVSLLGPSSCYALDALSFVASASLIGTVAIHRPLDSARGRPADGDRPTSQVSAILGDLLEGLRFIVRHAAVSFAVLAMAAGLFTLGCFGPLIAIHVRETLRASERVFGLVNGTIGAGLLAGTQVIRTVAMRFTGESLIFSGLAGIGAGVFLLGAVPTVWATFTATFTIGVAFGAIMVPAQTLMQQETPPAMMGRVSSSSSSLIVLGQVLGLAMSGVLADRLGIRAVFFVCAGIAGAMIAGGKVLTNASRAGR